VIPEYGHCWLGQAKPSVFTRLGAPRRLFISRQGRPGEGVGPTTDEWALKRLQAGQLSGVRGGAGDVGLWYAWPLLLSGKAKDGASKDAKAAPDRV
jgi:hypothetical protein